MVMVGIVYLVFEKKILVQSKMDGDSTAPADNFLSRTLIGIQVNYTNSVRGYFANLFQDRTYCSSHGRDKIKCLVFTG